MWGCGMGSLPERQARLGFRGLARTLAGASCHMHPQLHGRPVLLTLSLPHLLVVRYNRSACQYAMLAILSKCWRARMASTARSRSQHLKLPPRFACGLDVFIHLAQQDAAPRLSSSAHLDFSAALMISTNSGLREAPPTCGRNRQKAAGSAHSREGRTRSRMRLC